MISTAVPSDRRDFVHSDRPSSLLAGPPSAPPAQPSLLPNPPQQSHRTTSLLSSGASSASSASTAVAAAGAAGPSGRAMAPVGSRPNSASKNADSSPDTAPVSASPILAHLPPPPPPLSAQHHPAPSEISAPPAPQAGFSTAAHAASLSGTMATVDTSSLAGAGAERVPPPRAILVSDHHQINQHLGLGKLSSPSEDDLSLSDSMSEKLTDTAISSIHEDFDFPGTGAKNGTNNNNNNTADQPSPAAPADLNDPAGQPKPSAVAPAMSLLYSDTAPRSAWRPQLESWLKKHHPSQLREVERATSPAPVLDSLQSHWSYTAVNALHSAQIHEIKCQSISHRRTWSTDSVGETDLITRFSESAIAEEEDDVISASPPKKTAQHVRKSSSHSALRRKSYGSRDLKPYSRMPPSPTVHSTIMGPDDHYQRPRSQSNVQHASHRPGMLSPAEQHAIAVGNKKGRSPSFSSLVHNPLPSIASLADTAANYQPLSPPSSPNGRSHSNGSLHPLSAKRRCISCGSDQSPCWRPSWSASAGQLCNSCGLRYKKTNARCLTKGCGRIPAKGEWVSMKNLATKDPVTGALQYKCLYCNGDIEVGEKH